jgi:hypothetical protein
MEQSIGAAFECDCMKAQIEYSMSRDDNFDSDDSGTDHRIEIGIELRTIGAIAGGFKL